MIVLLGLSMTNCSNETVPPGTIGKIIDRSGWHPEIYPPSRVNVGMHGHLVLADTTTHTVNETVTIRTKDNMNLVAQVRFKVRLGDTPKSRNFVFNDIKPADGKTITLKQVYELHGKALVNKAVREVISEYNINDVNKNFNHISSDIFVTVKKMVKPTPLIVTDVSLGKMDFPKVIDDAIQKAAQRELDIQTAKADVLVKLTELKGKEQLAKGNYRIAMQKAKLDRDANKMIAAGITPELLELRKLELRKQELEKWNGIMPTTLLGANGSSTVLIGNK